MPAGGGAMGSFRKCGWWHGRSR